MKTLLVKARPVWGFTVKYPSQSAAQETLPYPPPSTLIGALASGYARLLSLPEKDGDKTSLTVRLLDYVRYATICIRGYGVKQSDPHRNIVIGFQRKERRRNPRYWYGLQAMGKVYFPDAEARIVYIVEDEQVDTLAKAAWNILYLGSKEGLITVEEVKVIDIEVVDDDYGETCYMTPKDLVASRPRRSQEIVFWDWRNRSNYRYGYSPDMSIGYYIPYNGMFYGCIEDCMEIGELNTARGVFIRIEEDLVPIPKTILEESKQ